MQMRPHFFIMATNFFEKIIHKIKTMNELKIVFQRPSVC